MEVDVPIRLRTHQVWSGDGKSGKTKTATILKKELEKVGVTLYHLDLDLMRGVNHYPGCKNIKLGNLSDVFNFQRNAHQMHKDGQLDRAVLLIDPLNPIFEWHAEDVINMYGSDNFISDKRVKFEGKELTALTAYYKICKEFIADIESWFPFVISVIHLKRSELGGEKDKVLYDSFQLYGQLRQYMHHKTDGAMMFSSTRDIEGKFTTYINKSEPHILNSLGMREDPEFALVKTADDLVKYYVDFLPKQFDYLKKEREKLINPEGVTT